MDLEFEGADLEHSVSWGLTPIAPPFRHHQKRCHLGFGAVRNCQRFVAASAESGAGSKVKLRLADSDHLLRACLPEKALPTPLPCDIHSCVRCVSYHIEIWDCLISICIWGCLNLNMRFGAYANQNSV